MNLQGSAQAQKHLRLCLYCLGLFKKQAFTLDHIRPVWRSRTQDPQSAAAYNDPTNRVAVCMSCNSFKNVGDLSVDWIKGRISERQRAGDPGFDNVPGKTQDDGVKALKQIFGL